MQNYPDLYIKLSNDYGAAVRSLRIASDYVNQSLVYVTQLSNVEAKLDIMDTIRKTNEQIFQITDYSKMLPAVRQLNHSSLTLSGFNDLNEYLVSNNIKVCQEWADLCGQTGVLVDSSNIDV